MGTITISLPKEYEAELRSTARKLFEGKKNALSKTIILALNALRSNMAELKSNKARELIFYYLNHPFKVKGHIPKRDEIYDRKIFG